MQKTYIIPFSNHFKGFQKFLINVHNNEEAEKNNLMFLNIDLSDSEFMFTCFDTEYGRKAVLTIDGKEVGSVLNEEQVAAIENGMIDKIHARPKNAERLSFFVKYKE